MRASLLRPLPFSFFLSLFQPCCHSYNALFTLSHTANKSNSELSYLFLCSSPWLHYPNNDTSPSLIPSFLHREGKCKCSPFSFLSSFIEWLYLNPLSPFLCPSICIHLPFLTWSSPSRYRIPSPLSPLPSLVHVIPLPPLATFRCSRFHSNTTHLYVHQNPLFLPFCLFNRPHFATFALFPKWISFSIFIFASPKRS